MGLIVSGRIGERVRMCLDNAYWRARYWWFDTESGAFGHSAVFVISCLVVVFQTARLALTTAMPPPPGTPQKAIYWWVIQLIILVISAIVAYALRPKVEQQKPAGANPPSTEDGQAVVDILGTGWIDDYFVLAWKPNGYETIKAKGKK